MELGQPKDPRFKIATDEFYNALDELKEAQDPYLKDALREIAKEKLNTLADIIVGKRLHESTRPRPQSTN